jgi:hypothetical protein
LADDVDVGPASEAYVLWESWDVFFTFYSGIRAELDARWPEREHWASEQLFLTWATGGDVDAMRDQIEDERTISDPRLLLDVP